MTARKPATRKTTRRKPVKRTSSVRKPRATTRGQKLATWAAIKIGEQAEKHQDVIISRKAAAILRITHEGCTVCKGNGQVFKKDKKTGVFAGSVACPAKPTKAKAGRMRVAIAARFGPDRRSGLIGWTCPCGSKEKPRFRDAKTATQALRTHERRKHGGKGVGGSWYGQIPQSAAEQATPAPPTAPVSKAVTDSGMTDADWIKQNKPPAPAAAAKSGKCWCCTEGRIFTAFGDDGQRVVVCGVCRGTGKATPTPATV